MKKVILFGLTGLFLLGLSSCGKECTCKTIVDGETVAKYTEPKSHSKKCSEYEYEYDDDNKVICK